MSVAISDETTRQPARPGRSSGDGHGDDLVPALTILSHPDLRRIGDIAPLLELGLDCQVALSRTEPSFAPPGAIWDARPLDDPYLSRRPWILRPVGAGVSLHSHGSSIDLEMHGEPVADGVEISDVDLGRGVVVTLEHRIALLLHHIPTELPPSGSGSDMVGASAGLTRVRAAIGRVADLDVPVLLRGESGTGKELAARSLHDRSRRAARPFVAVNLGALSPSLAASELFGHVKGAFTGAVTAREGYFRAAEGGTLFLDEVGEAPSEVQAMLLRALDNGQIVPVGSHTPRQVDVRLVAATDSDLEGRARRGDFKEPLLHRLSAYEIQLPPLRERRDDLGRLFVFLAREFLRDLGEEELLDRCDPDAPPWLPADLMTRLAGFHWPGNVRQLKNVVRQLVIDSRSERQLRAGARLETLLTEPPAAEPDPTADSPGVSRRPAQVTDAELEAAMRGCRFEPAAAARQLGISRPSLYNLIGRHPTLRTAEDVPENELEAALADAEGDPGRAAERLEVSVRALARRLARSP